MSILNVSIIIILVIIVLFIVFYFNSQSNILYDKLLDTAADEVTQTDAIIKYENNKSTLSNLTSNFSLSLWFFIENWTPGKKKTILYMSANNNADLTSSSLSNTENPYLWIYMDEYTNELIVKLRQNEIAESSGASPNVNEYKVKNIKFQKWNCLTISIDSHVMDVYMNGKLINSFVLTSIFERTYERPNIYLGYYGIHKSIIEGYITRVRYYNTYISSPDAYNIYKEGINQSFLNKLSNSYNLKMALMENGIEKAKISI